MLNICFRPAYASWNSCCTLSPLHHFTWANVKIAQRASCIWKLSSSRGTMSSYDSYGTPSKPDPNCRTCTDFKYWSQQQRQIFHKSEPKDPKEGSCDGGDKKPREDCPFDKEALGKATWGLLHTMAAFYSDNPTDDQKKDTKTFIETLSRIYPCSHCSKDFRIDLSKNPVNVDSQNEFSQWLCKFHNRVNVKLGKPVFDCSKVNERWRDGWLDGSCD